MKRVTSKSNLAKLKKNGNTSFIPKSALLSWPVFNAQAKLFTIAAKCVKNKLTSRWQTQIAQRLIKMTINKNSTIIIHNKSR